MSKYLSRIPLETKILAKRPAMALHLPRLCFKILPTFRAQSNVVKMNLKPKTTPQLWDVDADATILDCEFICKLQQKVSAAQGTPYQHPSPGDGTWPQTPLARQNQHVSMVNRECSKEKKGLFFFPNSSISNTNPHYSLLITHLFFVGTLKHMLVDEHPLRELTGVAKVASTTCFAPASWRVSRLIGRWVSWLGHGEHLLSFLSEKIYNIYLPWYEDTM